LPVDLDPFPVAFGNQRQDFFFNRGALQPMIEIIG
jgi:hypothetical protein